MEHHLGRLVIPWAGWSNLQGIQLERSKMLRSRLPDDLCIIWTISACLAAVFDWLLSLRLLNPLKSMGKYAANHSAAAVLSLHGGRSLCSHDQSGCSTSWCYHGMSLDHWQKYLEHVHRAPGPALLITLLANVGLFIFWSPFLSSCPWEILIPAWRYFILIYLLHDSITPNWRDQLQRFSKGRSSYLLNECVWPYAFSFTFLIYLHCCSLFEPCVIEPHFHAANALLHYWAP